MSVRQEPPPLFEAGGKFGFSPVIDTAGFIGSCRLTTVFANSK
jgi:hypothetical protein